MAQAELQVLIHAKDEASKTIQGVGNATQNMSRNLKIAGGVMMGVGAGITAAMGMALKASAEEEAGIQKLSVAMKNVGVSYDSVRDSLESWIDAQQQKTAVADSDQRESLSSLILMTGSLTESQELLTLAMDVARGTGRDLAGATQLIQYAYAGNWGMLERYIPAIKQAADEEEKWMLLRELFTGQAEAYGQTMAGQFELLKNNIGDIKETIGSFVASALLPLIQYVQNVVQGIKAWTERHPALAKTITLVVLGLGALLIPLGALLMMLPLLINGWTTLTALVSVATIKLIAHKIALIAHSVVMGASKIAMIAATAAQWALNAAMSANPIGLIILLIAGLVAGIIALVKNWDKVVGALRKVKDWFIRLKDAIVGFIKGAIDWLKEKLEAVIKPFKVLWNWISKLIGHSPGVVMLEEEMTELGESFPLEETKEFAESGLAPTNDEVDRLVRLTGSLIDNMHALTGAIMSTSEAIVDKLIASLNQMYQAFLINIKAAQQLLALLYAIAAEKAKGGCGGGGGGGGGGGANEEEEEDEHWTPPEWQPPKEHDGYELPMFQRGGVMPFTGLAFLHRGETVLPNRATITVPIYLDSELISQKVVELVGNKARLRGY